MFSMYALISVMTVSTVLICVSETKPAEVTIGGIARQSKSETSMMVMEHNDRESNIRYVMAIKNSSFWTEIKKRSLTISSEPITGSIINKSPDNLSDEELSQLKQVCQDGLKCVAVDHLLILTQVMQPSDDGKTSARTAITKITKVLTKYTNEYHEDTYQYEEVTDKDDTAKVYSSVTTIVEDNEELCQIDSNTYTRSGVNSYATTKTNVYLSSYENANESSNKSSVNNSNKSSDGSPGGSSGGSLNGNSDGNTEQDGPLTIVNNGNLNFGNVNTYHINEGTINSATVNLDSSKNPDGSNKMPKKVSINVSSEPSTPELDNTSTTQNDDQNTSTSQNDDQNTSTSQNDDQNTNTSQKDDQNTSTSQKDDQNTSTTQNDDQNTSTSQNDDQNTNTSQNDDQNIITSQNDDQNTSTSQNDNQSTSTSLDKGTLDDRKESSNYVNIYEYGSEEPSNTGTPDSDTNNPNQGNSSLKTVVPADIRLTPIKSSGKAKAKKPTDTIGDQNVTSKNFKGDSSSNANKSEASKNITDGSADTTGSKNNVEKSKNFVSLSNANKATQGENSQTVDIVSAGHHNTGRINKGYVEDGNINNGIMKLIEKTKGSKNKGVIDNGNAKNGIINVGNVNNGKTKYNTTNERINNGDLKTVNNYDVQQFVNNLNNMYSSMLNDLARQ